MHCLQKFLNRCIVYLRWMLCNVTFEVFLYLNHEDLMTLLTVCKFWAAVAERPQLWTEFRQVAANLL